MGRVGNKAAALLLGGLQTFRQLILHSGNAADLPQEPLINPGNFMDFINIRSGTRDSGSSTWALGTRKLKLTPVTSTKAISRKKRTPNGISRAA